MRIRLTLLEHVLAVSNLCKVLTKQICEEAVKGDDELIG